MPSKMSQRAMWKERRDREAIKAFLKKAEKDPGLMRDAIAAAKEMAYQLRYALCRKAVEAAHYHPERRERFEKPLALGQGVWWDELGPLAPAEREIVLNELRDLWGIPRKGFAKADLRDIVNTSETVQALKDETPAE